MCSPNNWDCIIGGAIVLALVYGGLWLCRVLF